MSRSARNSKGVCIDYQPTGCALLIPRSNAAEDWISTVDTDATNGATQPTDTSGQQRWLDLRGAIIASGSVGQLPADALALAGRLRTVGTGAAC